MIRAFALLFCLVTCECGAQVDSMSYHSVVTKAKDLIRENYIIGDKIKDLVDSLDPVKYEFLSQQDFVSQFNKELLRISQDKHLRLEYNPSYSEKLLSSGNPNEEQKLDERKTNYGFERVEILPHNIGYLKLAYFAEPTDLTPLIKSVFTFVQHTEGLIVDLRGNSGGTGSMAQILVSGLLQETPSPILTISYKGTTVELKTDSDPVFSYNNPVYLLCDNKTFSAGEAFAFILQNRKRAVVVGGTTAGAGNIAGPHRLDKNFILTIPVGVIVDPLTNKGWEGVGVVPDIETDASVALSRALDIINKTSRGDSKE